MIAALLSAALPNFGLAQSADLATERMAIELERAVAAQDHERTLGLLEKLKPTVPISHLAQLRLVEADAAHRLGDYNRAFDELVAFFHEEGSDSPLYPLALDLLAQVEPAVTAAYESGQTSAEAALRLTDAELTTIRFVLHRQLGNAKVGPSAFNPGGGLTDEDRALLHRFAQEQGLPADRFLTRQLADRLLGIGFVPPIEDLTKGDRRSVTRYGTWVASRTASGSCRIESHPILPLPTGLFAVPRMQFSLAPNNASKSMSSDFMLPVLFDAAAPVTLEIDGKRHALAKQRGRLTLPISAENTVSPQPLRDMARGSAIRLRGTLAATGREVAIAFDPRGFVAAFRHMMDDCARPNAAIWLRAEGEPMP